MSLPTVTFGGIPATVLSADANSIVCITPAHAAGVVNVVVTKPNGLNVTVSNGYTFVAPPNIVTVDPDFGVVAGGNTVTITGTGFQAGATVTFDGEESTVLSVTSVEIQCEAPAHALGFVDVKVENPDGQYDVSENGYEYSLYIIGLNADYYAGSAFNTFAYSVNEPNIDRAGYPDPPVDGFNTDFSIRWTGYIVALYSETYTLRIDKDDRAKLWLDDVLVLNADAEGYTHTTTFAFTAGQKYELRFDYWNVGILPSCYFYWQSASQAFQIIPASAFYTDAL